MLLFALMVGILAEWGSSEERGDRLAAGIQYFFEPNANLCFARNRDGGLAVVPYEQVKSLLLNPPPENQFETKPFDSPEETTIQTR